MEVNAAVSRLLNAEGEYSDHPEDRGGQTMCGISRRFWPLWPGWDVVDSYLARGEEPVLTEELRKLVVQFYDQSYWTPLRAAQMPDSVAYEVFEQAVNMGIVKAVRHLQEALNLLNRNGTSWQDIDVDGRVGPVTLRTLGKAKSRNVLETMQALQTCHYIQLARSDRSQEHFLRGWLSRT